jgi:hypothetical protein
MVMNPPDPLDQRERTQDEKKGRNAGRERPPPSVRLVHTPEAPWHHGGKTDRFSHVIILQ